MIEIIKTPKPTALISINVKGEGGGGWWENDPEEEIGRSGNWISRPGIFNCGRISSLSHTLILRALNQVDENDEEDFDKCRDDNFDGKKDFIKIDITSLSPSAEDSSMT